MKMRELWVPGGIVLGLLAGVGAARADPGYNRCLKTAMSNVAMDGCGADLLKRSDAALNQAWKRTLALTSGRTKTDLLTEQRAWIAFKEASCRFYANGERGREGAVLSFPACRAAVIDARTRQLRDIGQDLAPR